MTRRLLPLPIRITILLRSRSGPFLILALAAVAMSALDWRAGSLESSGARIVVMIGVPLVLTTIGASLRKGVALLWVQKPVDPVRFHVARFAEGALVSVALSALIASIFIAVALRSGWEPVMHPLRPVATDALFAFVMASIGFGCCATLPRGGKLAALALVGVTVAREALAPPDPASTDWLRSSLVDMMLFPLTPLMELRASDGVEAESLLRPLAWVLCYAGAWVAIGALGIRRVFSRGGWVRLT